MRINIFQKIVPFSNKTKTVDSFVCWQVRWVSRSGEYISDVKPEIASFPLEKDARDFKESLEAAFRLLKHSGHGTGVSIEKVSS